MSKPLNRLIFSTAKKNAVREFLNRDIFFISHVMQTNTFACEPVLRTIKKDCLINETVFFSIVIKPIAWL